MKLFLNCSVAMLAIAACVLFSPSASAQYCQGGVCHFGEPVVAAPDPYFVGPVIIQPAPVFISPGICHSPGCSRSKIVYACNGSQCQSAPHCRPAPHDWRLNQNANCSRSFGISLNWNRSGSGRCSSRWH